MFLHVCIVQKDVLHHWGPSQGQVSLRGHGLTEAHHCMFLSDEGFSLDLASLVLICWSWIFANLFSLKSVYFFFPSISFYFCSFWDKWGEIKAKFNWEVDWNATPDCFLVPCPQTGASVAHPEDELERLTKKMLFDMDNPPSEEYFGEWI